MKGQSSDQQKTGQKGLNYESSSSTLLMHWLLWRLVLLLELLELLLPAPAVCTAALIGRKLKPGS